MTLRKDFKDGLLDNHPVTVQMLGLCPLLAVSTTVINAIAMALTTALCLMASAAASALIAPFVSRQMRIAIYVAVIAGCVTAADIILQAKAPLIHQSLGLFIPLIVTNCIILGRIEAHSAQHPLKPALSNAIAMACGFSIILVLLGASREIIGQAQLFGDAVAIFGPDAKFLAIEFNHQPMLLAVLPAGAFIILGFIVVGFNYLRHAFSPASRDSTVRPSPQGSDR